MASIAQILEEEVSALSVLELPVREAFREERRAAPRVAGRFGIQCTSGETYTGVDLSFGGLLCVGDEPLWPGNYMRFALTLPGEERPLHVTGRVVELVSYRGKVGMRVRFLELEQQARRRVAQWMTRESNR